MNINTALRSELARAVRNRKYERADTGIYLPQSKVLFAGVFKSWVNDGPVTVSPNLVVDEALDNILDVYFGSAAAPVAYYLAPFSGSVTPTSGTTAATFASSLTEYTDYSESSRAQWTPGSVSGKEINNNASPATFTVSQAGGTVWGFGMLTSAAKSDTSGLLIAATKDTQAKTGLTVGDTLNVTYGFSATDV